MRQLSSAIAKAIWFALQRRFIACPRPEQPTQSTTTAAIGRHLEGGGFCRDGSKYDLVAPSRHDRSCSRSRLELKRQEGLDLPDRITEGDRHTEDRSLVVPRERKGYAASSRAISVSKSKRNCAPSSNGKTAGHLREDSAIERRAVRVPRDRLGRACLAENPVQFLAHLVRVRIIDRRLGIIVGGIWPFVSE